MKIAIDARSLTTRPTGVGQYLMAAVNVWSKQEPDIEFILLAHKPLNSEASPYLRRAQNIRFECCPAPLMGSNGLFWMLYWFAQYANKLGATHIWGASGMLPFLGIGGLVKILTVHDLVFRSMPLTMSLKSRIAYGLLAGRSIRQADVIWSVSGFTSNEIDRYYPNLNTKVRVTGSGLNPLRFLCKPNDGCVADVVVRYGVTHRALLFVGTLEPRKNLAFLLSLMPRLSQDGFNLLVVGCSGWGKSDLASILNEPTFPREVVRFCDYVPDEDLQALYCCVAFFISTSLMEGFGLPHLEAMSAGCPVIAAANSAIIEVVGDGGILITDWSKDEWYLRIIEAFTLQGKLKTYAIRNSKRHLIDNVCKTMSFELATLSQRQYK